MFDTAAALLQQVRCMVSKPRRIAFQVHTSLHRYTRSTGVHPRRFSSVPCTAANETVACPWGRCAGLCGNAEREIEDRSAFEAGRFRLIPNPIQPNLMGSTPDSAVLSSLDVQFSQNQGPRLNPPSRHGVFPSIMAAFTPSALAKYSFRAGVCQYAS